MSVIIYLKEPENKWIKVSMSEDMFKLFESQVGKGGGIVKFRQSGLNSKEINIPVNNISYYLTEEENG